jgi:hypothetical protein
MKTEKDHNEENDFPGYPEYPSTEDIYNQEKKEAEIDPENPAKKKEPKLHFGDMNEKDFEKDVSGDDLDIPGSELDDDMEAIGSEDEENNYYSLGGDDKENLEEDQADKMV